MKLTFFSALVASAVMAVDMQTPLDDEDKFDLDFADSAENDLAENNHDNPSMDDFAQRYYDDFEGYGDDDDFDEDRDGLSDEDDSKP